MEIGTRIHAYTDDALGRLDACGIAARIASGEVSAREVVQAAVDRARVVDPQLNALAATDFDAALAAAGDADRSAATTRAPLHGVPTLIKDNTAVAGLPTQHGSVSFTAAPAAVTGRFAADMLATGMIALGKSRLPEFAFNVTCEYTDAEPVRNPWNPAFSAGGSSGGAAAMVAAGVVPVAHATDAGGSIRVPAAACGLVGLKPSRGRVAADPADLAMPLRIAVQSVVSRSVRDTAIMLTEAERHHRNPRLRPVRNVRGPGSTRLRIGVLSQSPTTHPLDADARAAIRATAELLSGLGHEVVEADYPVSPDYLREFMLYLGMLMAMIRANARRIVGSDLDRERMDATTAGIADHYLRSAAATPLMLARLAQVRRRYVAMFRDYDVLLSPTLAHATPELGHLTPDQDFDTWLDRFAAYDGIAPLNNISGTPAVTLPLHRTSSGLPCGVQFAGGIGEERTLLELAFELEEAASWPLIDNSWP
ncbi:amidase [Mycobacterium frederiksbergense]|uniref:amidase n=1 Tax=Mycolicibacterium frederiksbergense TaxID=117567 RepID=A0ABT6L0U7_9MYCO|nr:amidase [Mycolicibacterium frederiksbergense]MDH6196566.1 amidase [Mycolicibacterium frederiksbergense]